MQERPKTHRKTDKDNEFSDERLKSEKERVAEVAEKKTRRREKRERRTISTCQRKRR